MHNPQLGSVGRTFICSVVFVDIVAYSKKTVAKQVAQRGWFNGMLSEALQGISQDDRIVIDAGDGAAICLLGDPEEAVFITNALRVAIAEHAYPEFALRMGINLGPVKMAKDIHGQPNIIGDGINVAQRIMSFAQPNQILVSRSYYDIVSRISDEYERLFRYQGEHTDKHVRAHQVYEVMVRGPSEAKSAPPPEPAGAVVAQPSASALDAALVDALGIRLTGYLGPIAPLLAKKTARKAGSVTELIGLLADCVPVPAQREQFMLEARKSLPAAAREEPPASREAPSREAAEAPPASFDGAALARVEKLLARQVGPMAAVIVKRAARGARGRRELVAALAASIDDAAERGRFEDEAWSALGAGGRDL
ncbi:MAG TPA: adenylate/guanylate cyclase domain-containing protein [Burkholderiales bacterium]|nr:adenylate/guanylate cyclase domain-containing protein [Burkholderiales bacterium]